MPRNLNHNGSLSSGRKIKFAAPSASMAHVPSERQEVVDYPSLTLSLARPSASSADPPLPAPLLPFSVTVALVSDESLRFSTVTVFLAWSRSCLGSFPDPTPDRATGSCPQASLFAM